MKKVVSIILAALLLVSNIGFSKNVHYCAGIAVKSTVSVGLHKLDCGMQGMDLNCESDYSDQTTVQKRSCCENEHQIFQLKEEVKVQPSYELQPLFVVAFVHTFLVPVFVSSAEQTNHTAYTPPIWDKDLNILFQNFLI